LSKIDTSLEDEFYLSGLGGSFCFSFFDLFHRIDPHHTRSAGIINDPITEAIGITDGFDAS
jgi:hypothetical protein